MASKLLPSPDVIRQLLRYEPETGCLFWLRRDRHWFRTDHEYQRWNARYAGGEAFTAVNGNGYRHGAIFGRVYCAHRVIWAMEMGEWPSALIDHQNQDRSDNRLTNLRLATPSQNSMNKRKPNGAVSKYIGVHWHHKTGKWLAGIAANGRARHIGLYDNEEDAARARDSRAKEMHGAFASLNFPGAAP